MNTARISGIIDGMCERETSRKNVDLLCEIRSHVQETDDECSDLKRRFSRLSGFEYLSDEQLATLLKFQRGHEYAHVGRKSTVKEVRSHIEFYWDWFLKIPAAWREKMEEIEREYPKSVVYKALKALC